jgi:hypothetical protein
VVRPSRAADHAHRSQQLDDDKDAEAARPAPYVGPRALYLHYVEGRPPIPLGIFDHPDSQPGVATLPIPDGWLSRGVRDLTRFAERLDDLLPGLGDFLPTPWS